MSSNRRKSVRRAIGYGAKIIATDGSWAHDCRVIDVSDSHVMWVKDGEIGVVFERRAQPR